MANLSQTLLPPAHSEATRGNFMSPIRTVVQSRSASLELVRWTLRRSIVGVIDKLDHHSRIATTTVCCQQKTLHHYCKIEGLTIALSDREPPPRNRYEQSLSRHRVCSHWYTGNTINTTAARDAQVAKLHRGGNL